MKPLWLILTSRKFAVWLLALLIGVSIAQVLFPDYKITASPLILPLPAMLFVSILACSIRRIATRKEDRAALPEGEVIQRETGGAPDLVRRKIADILRAGGWRVDDTKPEGVMAFQGEPGFWGSTIFHIGMLIILAGMVMSMLSRSSSGFTITEGETIDLMTPGVIQSEASYLGVLKVPLRLTLKQFNADYVGGEHPVDYRALLWAEGAGRTPGELLVQVNRSFRCNDADIFLDKYGYAPRFVLTKEDGTVLSDYHYTISAREGKTDTFEMPEAGLMVTAQLFPNFQLNEGNTVKNVSQEPKNIGVLLTIAKEGRVVVDRAFVPLAKKVHFEGRTLQFAGWKYWAHFGISRDLGVPWILVGFLALVGGLILRFSFPDRMVWVKITGSTSGSRGGSCVAVGGHGGHFPAMFRDELKRLADEMAKS